MTVLTRALAQALVDEQGFDVVIPDIYTSISDYAFQYAQLASVVIPDSITSIGNFAFDYTQMTSVEIGSSVTSIGEYAFSYNELASAVIPDSVISIGNFAFNVNKIASVVIPDSVISIGMGAFYENELTDIEIGNSVVLIDSMAFKRNKLMHIVIPDSVTSLGPDVFKENPLKSISIFKDPLFDQSMIPEGVEIDKRGINDTPFNINISDQSFKENISVDSAVATLSTSDLDSGDTHTYSLVSGTGDIDNNAFTIDGDLLKIKASPDYESQDSYSVRLQTKDSGGLTYEKSFVLTVIEVGALTKELTQALVDEQGKDIIIPDYYNSIGEYAFARYHDITSVVIPDSVTSIGDRAFYANDLTSVVIPDSVTSIGDLAFYVNELTSVEIGNSVTSIGRYAFYDNELTSIVIPDSVTSIGENVFAENDLTSVVIPDSITSIGNRAFSYNDLTSAVIPDSVTSIGTGAFLSNDLTSVVIPDSVTSIGARAFYDNDLTSAVIPDSVTTIGEYAFNGNDLTSIAIGDSVKSIGGYAFEGNQLTSVVIPDSVKSIGNGAFSGNQLTSVDIGDSVKSIGGYAFCRNKLTSVEIGNSVTSIGRHAFYENELTSIVIPDSVTDIGKKAFDKNPLLESISISADPTFKLTSFPRGVEIIRRADPSVIDSDGDGFVDGASNYQMWTNSGGIDLTNKGRTVSDDTSKKWDAIKAIQTDSGFSILLRGDGKKQGKFQIVSANEKGEGQDSSPWKTALQMFKGGNEDVFDTDFNGNGEIGFMAPTAISLSTSTFNENISSGSVVSNLTSTDLDPDDTHTYSLVSGIGDIDNSAFSIKGDKLKISASPDYETQSSYSIRLKTTDSSGGLSYEAPFTLNVNDLDEGSGPSDADGDGFVDGITNYQVLTGTGGVDLVNKKGKKYSDKSSRKWDAVKAITDFTDFSDESSIGVLISGSGKKDNKFKMWSANLESGLVTTQTKWKNEPWMIKQGYEEIFAYDINDNGVIGS